MTQVDQTSAASHFGVLTTTSRRPFGAGRRVGRLALLVTALLPAIVLANQVDLVGPAGSAGFGSRVTVLPNGNIVVVDPNGPASGVGAVYLYPPDGGAPISTITGIAANDHIGSGGIVVLANGNYLILSPAWHNGGAVNAGAVTWANASSGISGLVSPANSLVGSNAADGIGASPVLALGNGNYVVVSARWDDGATADAGAVTWGNGASGISGAVGSANSLIGGHANAEVGGGGVFAVGGSNYVIASPLWDNAGEAHAGAVTWVNGASGATGLVSSANSLVGASANDNVGAVTVLSNGNYVVATPAWDDGSTRNAGAVTWASGTSGRIGTVSAANSLIGSTDNDAVGSVVSALSNGHYVVGSPDWENAGVAKVGAVTWCSGVTTTSAVVSVTNSLIGSSQNDRVGSGGALALSNGNYVVQSPLWRNGGVAAGAATWRSGTAASAGVVAGTNSYVGTSAADAVGALAYALTNGNYVLASPSWDQGATANVGAVTWGSGTAASAGPLSVVNSLIGSQVNDAIGNTLIVLSNGHYVSASSSWDNGASIDAGAATFGNGSAATSGSVSAQNSLVGGSALDGVGRALLALENGDYLVSSPDWNSGALVGAGALTRVAGNNGQSGTLVAAGSMVGSQANDHLGQQGLIKLANQKVAVLSALYDNAGLVDVGAVSLIDTSAPLPAGIAANESVFGSSVGGGVSMATAIAVGFDAPRNQLAVGRPASNIVTLLRVVDPIYANGFE